MTDVKPDAKKYQLSFRQPANPGERFAPGCFDGMEGREVVLRVGVPTEEVTGTLVSAEVAEDGYSAWFTVETDTYIGFDKLIPPV